MASLWPAALVGEGGVERSGATSMAAFRAEQAALRLLGVDLADEHLDGYSYRPERFDAEVTETAKPWEVSLAEQIDGLLGPSQALMSESAEAWKNEEFLFEIREGIAYCTLNRPSANNAMNDGINAGLHDAIRRDATSLCRPCPCARVSCRATLSAHFGLPRSFPDLPIPTVRPPSVRVIVFLREWNIGPQFAGYGGGQEERSQRRTCRGSSGAAQMYASLCSQGVGGCSVRVATRNRSRPHRPRPGSSLATSARMSKPRFSCRRFAQAPSTGRIPSRGMQCFGNGWFSLGTTPHRIWLSEHHSKQQVRRTGHGANDFRRSSCRRV